jgi:hypothetical protein
VIRQSCRAREGCIRTLVASSRQRARGRAALGRVVACVIVHMTSLDTRASYAQLRSMACRSATTALHTRASAFRGRSPPPVVVLQSISVTDIGRAEIEEWHQRWLPHHASMRPGRVAWRWDEQLDHWRSKSWSYFAACAKLDGILFMLAIGRLNKNAVVVERVERVPVLPERLRSRLEGHQGLAATCAFTGAEAYAVATNRASVQLDDPLPERVDAFVTLHGFTWSGATGKPVLQRSVSWRSEE